MMDWERKFLDIVQETESNLQNARRKLLANGLARTTPTHSESHSPSQHIPSSFQPSASSFVNNNDHINAIRRQMGWDPTSTPKPSVHFGIVPQAPDSSEIRELQMKIESQSQMIEKLEKVVKTLNEEKNQHCRQVRDLQKEVDNINTRLNEPRGMDPKVEKQVNLIRKEVQSDVQRLQNLIDTSKTTPLQASSLESSFKQMHQSVHSELEELRRDLNSIMHRVGKLELDVSTHSASASHRAKNQSYDRLPMSFETPSTAEHAGQIKPVPRRLSPVIITPADVFEMRELRNTVAKLHDKLDSVEGRVVASQFSSPAHSPNLANNCHRKPKSPKPSRKMYGDFTPVIANNSSDLDDLDLNAEFDLDIPDHGADLVNVGLEKPKPSKLKASDDFDLNLSDSDNFSEDLNELVRAGKKRRVKTKLSPPRIKSKSPRRKNDASAFNVQLPFLSSLAYDATGQADELSDLDFDSHELGSDNDSVELDSLDDLKLDDL